MDILTKKFDRQRTIHDKGFSMNKYSYQEMPMDNAVVDYSKVKIGNGPVKPVTDAVINLNTAIQKVNSLYTDKETILQAIQNNDLE